MSGNQGPIGWPVKSLCFVVGLCLVLVGIGSANSDDPELRHWWLPVLFGGPFFLPLYSRAARRGEGPSLRRRSRDTGRVQRWVSGLSFGGAFATQLLYRFLFPDSGPITGHPIFGPAMIVFSVLFFVGAFLQFYAAYLSAKAETAT